MRVSEGVIRPYTPADFPAVKRLHEASGLEYDMPDLSSHLFLITKVVERDGKIVMAAGARIETELYLWMSHDVGTPEERWEDLQRLNQSVMQDAWLNGIDDCVCWVPESIEKSFQKRLRMMGFNRDRDGWHSWSRKTNESNQ